MPNITKCTACGVLYEESSWEAANDPRPEKRRCPKCHNKKMCKYLESFYITTSYDNTPKLVHKCRAYYAARGDEDCTVEREQTCFHRKCHEDPLDIMAILEGRGGYLTGRRK
jgi:hypothetical protein